MDKRINQKRVFWAALALYFLFFLGLNVLTPLASDDYRYAFSFATGERITSFWQIFPSLYEHYFVMHGRTAVHFFTQLMMLLGKPVFNVLNAAVSTLLLLGLYRLAVGRGEKNPTVLLGLSALLFLFMPAFGQTMLWLDGACNYLWGVTIIVWVLMPFRDALLSKKGNQSAAENVSKKKEGAKPPFRDALLEEKKAKSMSGCQKTLGMLEGSQPFDVQSETSDMRGGFGTLRSKGSLHGGLAVSTPSACEQARSATSIKRQSRFIEKVALPLFLLGSLFMGASSENGSPAAILVMVVCTALLWKKTGKLYAWAAASCGLAVIGFLILVLSPANAVRSVIYAAEGASRMGQYLLNFQAAAYMLRDNGLPLCCVFLVLFALAAAQKADKDRLRLAALLFLAGLAANFAMMLSNGYPPRAMTGFAVLTMAAAGVLLPDALRGGFRPLVIGAVACAVFIAAVTALSILPKNYNRYAEANSARGVCNPAARSGQPERHHLYAGGLDPLRRVPQYHRYLL